MAGLPLLERAIASLAPGYAAERARARLRLDALERVRSSMPKRPRGYYDGATRGRRTEGWRTPGTGPSAEARGALTWLRNRSRDLVRNDPWATRAISAVSSNTVCYGINYSIGHPSKQVRTRLALLAKRHLQTPAIDASGRHNIFGLQRLGIRTVAESGEVLARRRRRYSSDGLPLPFQVELLEPDHLDHTKDGTLASGNHVTQGVEHDEIGRRVAYWLFPQHPGEGGRRSTQVSERVPAADVLHVFREDRRGQVRGIPWLAPAIITLRDLADYEDAALLRQKIAACFALVESGGEGEDGDSAKAPLLDQIEPGMILRPPPGRTITAVNPPGVGDYDPFTKSQLRKIAASVPLPFEVLTGNLSDVNFSSGRMGWLEFQRVIEEWRWMMLIPQLCDGIAAWFLEDAAMLVAGAQEAAFDWHPPPREMIAPEKEIPPKLAAVAGGLTTWDRLLREDGIDPAQHWAEYAENLGVIEPFRLTSDPRVAAAKKLPTKPAAPQPAAA